MRLLVFTLIYLASSLLFAVPTSVSVRTEIDTLLSHLQSSGCHFNRNGTWYSGAESKNHLLRKLDYLERKSVVSSTEQFILLAAATSSASGKPYQVKCGTEAAVESQQWLSDQLAVIRSSVSKGKP